MKPEHVTKYRADIDGLRAVAVLSVMVFHAFPTTLKGGFTGVDVFFVISGYLITTIILENLGAEKFSFFEFYTRRVRRIFPALLVVLIACLVAGRFALLPDEVTALGKQTAAGAGFVSNLLLWSEAGYFDTDAIRKPLLHLWSLGIEEQYYIVWPLLLSSLWKRGKKSLVPVTTLLGLASFALSVWQAKADPVAAFYSPLTRFCELFIGSALAYLTVVRGSKLKVGGGHVQSLLGLAMLGAGMVLITKDRLFPGFWALLPTVGAALIIAAGADAWPNRMILANRAMVFIGLISFPLYLWHWPLLSFATIINDELPSRQVRAGLVVAAIPLAWLTYRLVERPIRFGAHRGQAVRVVFLLMVATGLLGLFTPAFLRPSFSAAQSAQVMQLSKVSALRNDMKTMYGERSCMKWSKDQTVDMFLQNGCVDVKHPELPTAFLIGDSLSGSLAEGLRPLMEARKLNLLQVSTGWCEPTMTDETDRTCGAINKMVLEKVGSTHPDVVVFTTNWLVASVPAFYVGPDYRAHLTGYLATLRRAGAKKVFVVGMVPTWKSSLPSVLTRNFVMRDRPIPARTFEGVQADSLAMDGRMRSMNLPDGVTYLSVKDVLCNEAGCLTAVGPNLESDLTVWDYGHLMPHAARFVCDALFASIQLP
jgi:peptidoglycan/LPS O-acetylase OafA/YrhL